MKVKIEPSWQSVLADEFDQEYFQSLTDFVKQEYQSARIYPPGSQIFNAFDFCPFDKVKVVILGQDPYHGAGQAHGLCFSVNPGVTTPPSLINIFKEIKADLGKEFPSDGNLEHWAHQGILLLNATLTVRASDPGSHQNKGWEQFTDAAIRAISESKENIVFMLWGAYAQRKGEIIDRSRHHVLQSPHPSPFSANRGFLGNKHFSQCNNYLASKGISQIEW